ncbi:MAG TPA: hypothetical protein VNJ51_13615 [Candidatus Dormibacteraeota bacterium]|nr:hypothetical protein [Candidatus Dormibacteraeota bacterium]
MAMERVRREVRLPDAWSVEDFERALHRFVELYGRRPEIIFGAPAVLERFCRYYERSPERAYGGSPQFEGIPLHAAILPPDVVAFEGEVDEEILGDW